MNCIEVNAIRKTYQKLIAVADLSFSIKKNEIFGLLGTNGAGKTTTLSIIEGILLPDTGTVSIFGKIVTATNTTYKRLFGAQLQGISLFEEFTVMEHLLLFSDLYGKRLKKPQAVILLEEFGLQQKINTFPRFLSGGQRQKLSLACALCHDPQILVLDEPSAGLDAQARRILWYKIKQLQNNGTTILLTTHYIEEAEFLCDRVGIMDEGRLLAMDTPTVLINQTNSLSIIKLPANNNLLSLENLKNLSAVHKVFELNGRISIQSWHLISTLNDLLKLSQYKGINLGELHIKQPSLEDAFLQLTGKQIEENIIDKGEK